MRSLDYSDTRQMKDMASRKATDMPKPASSLSGVTLWGTSVGPAPDIKAAQGSRQSPRCNHLQNVESPYVPRPTSKHNHNQNVETSPVAYRGRLKESRINESHLSRASPAPECSPARVKTLHSRINEGSIVFGAHDAPKSKPPPRVEPFQETPRRGCVRQTLPGFTDAGKFCE